MRQEVKFEIFGDLNEVTLAQCCSYLSIRNVLDAFDLQLSCREAFLEDLIDDARSLGEEFRSSTFPEDYTSVGVDVGIELAPQRQKEVIDVIHTTLDMTGDSNRRHLKTSWMWPGGQRSIWKCVKGRPGLAFAGFSPLPEHERPFVSLLASFREHIGHMFQVHCTDDTHAPGIDRHDIMPVHSEKDLWDRIVRGIHNLINDIKLRNVHGRIGCTQENCRLAQRGGVQMASDSLTELVVRSFRTRFTTRPGPMPEETGDRDYDLDLLTRHVFYREDGWMDYYVSRVPGTPRYSVDGSKILIPQPEFEEERSKALDAFRTALAYVHKHQELGKYPRWMQTPPAVNCWNARGELEMQRVDGGIRIFRQRGSRFLEDSQERQCHEGDRPCHDSSLVGATATRRMQKGSAFHLVHRRSHGGRSGRRRHTRSSHRPVSSRAAVSGTSSETGVSSTPPVKLRTLFGRVLRKSAAARQKEARSAARSLKSIITHAAAASGSRSTLLSVSSSIPFRRSVGGPLDKASAGPETLPAILRRLRDLAAEQKITLVPFMPHDAFVLCTDIDLHSKTPWQAWSKSCVLRRMQFPKQTHRTLAILQPSPDACAVVVCHCSRRDSGLDLVCKDMEIVICSGSSDDVDKALAYCAVLFGPRDDTVWDSGLSIELQARVFHDTSSEQTAEHRALALVTIYLMLHTNQERESNKLSSFLPWSSMSFEDLSRLTRDVAKLSDGRDRRILASQQFQKIVAKVQAASTTRKFDIRGEELMLRFAAGSFRLPLMICTIASCVRSRGSKHPSAAAEVTKWLADHRNKLSDFFRATVVATASVDQGYLQPFLTASTSKCKTTQDPSEEPQEKHPKLCSGMTGAARRLGSVSNTQQCINKGSSKRGASYSRTADLANRVDKHPKVNVGSIRRSTSKHVVAITERERAAQDRGVVAVEKDAVPSLQDSSVSFRSGNVRRGATTRSGRVVQSSLVQIFDEDTPWAKIVQLCHTKAIVIAEGAKTARETGCLPIPGGIANVTGDLCYFSVTLHTLRAMLIASPVTHRLIGIETADHRPDAKEVVLACCDVLQDVKCLLPRAAVDGDVPWRSVNRQCQAAVSLYMFIVTLCGLCMGDNDAAVTQVRSLVFLMVKDIGKGHSDIFEHGSTANYRDISVSISVHSPCINTFIMQIIHNLRLAFVPLCLTRVGGYWISPKLLRPRRDSSRLPST